MVDLAHLAGGLLNAPSALQADTLVLGQGGGDVFGLPSNLVGQRNRVFERHTCPLCEVWQSRMGCIAKQSDSPATPARHRITVTKNPHPPRLHETEQPSHAWAGV